jgi:hypothetical protein
MKRLSRKLTYANVISTICLFLLLGGGAAFAASKVHLGKNAVGANQLKKNAVTNAKIKNGAVTNAKLKDDAVTNVKIQNDAVTGAKVKDGSLTGSDIDQASLTGARASNVSTLLVGGKECAPIAPFPAGVSAERTSEGVCKVSFPSSVINCAASATPHFRLEPDQITFAEERSVQISSGTATPNVMAVGTYSAGMKKNYPFDLTLVC